MYVACVCDVCECEGVGGSALAFSTTDRGRPGPQGSAEAGPPGSAGSGVTCAVVALPLSLFPRVREPGAASRSWTARLDLALLLPGLCGPVRCLSRPHRSLKNQHLDALLLQKMILEMQKNLNFVKECDGPTRQHSTFFPKHICLFSSSSFLLLLHRSTRSAFLHSFCWGP